MIKADTLRCSCHQNAVCLNILVLTVLSGHVITIKWMIGVEMELVVKPTTLNAFPAVICRGEIKYGHYLYTSTAEGYCFYV